MAEMFRYEVPIDDQPHTLQLSGTVTPVRAVAVATRSAGWVMEFWHEHDRGLSSAPRTFQVFGTGHRLPDRPAQWQGTAARVEGLVFHLYELDPA